MTKTEQERQDKVRQDMRRTFQSMSDQALDFQDMRVSMNPCIARQELDREINRRRFGS